MVTLVRMMMIMMINYDDYEDKNYVMMIMRTKIMLILLIMMMMIMRTKIVLIMLIMMMMIMRRATCWKKKEYDSKRRQHTCGQFS